MSSNFFAPADAAEVRRFSSQQVQVVQEWLHQVRRMCWLKPMVKNNTTLTLGSPLQRMFGGATVAMSALPSMKRRMAIDEGAVDAVDLEDREVGLRTEEGQREVGSS
jgi:hypothetical protein